MSIGDIITEKYRPKNLDELALTAENRTILTKWLTKPDRHLLLWSPNPGSGKTSAAKALGYALAGREETTVINSAKARSLKDTAFIETLSSRRSIMADHKVIILDEADAYTKEAEKAILGVIETASPGTFFIATCNNIQNLSAPFQSRFMLLDFGAVDKALANEVLGVIKRVSASEGIDFDTEQAKELIQSATGNGGIDVRSIMNRLDGKSLEAANVSEVFDKLVSKDFGACMKAVAVTTPFGSIVDAIASQLPKDARLSATVKMELYKVMHSFQIDAAVKGINVRVLQAAFFATAISLI